MKTRAAVYTSFVMRALVYTAPNRVEMQDLPMPACAPGEVLVAVGMAGMCGSDISSFLGHSARRKPPLVLGHEMVGSTLDGHAVAVNPLMTCGRCTRCLSGQQNLCVSWRLLGMDRVQGVYAEYVAVPAEQIHRLPEGLPLEQAVITEPLANIVHLYRLLGAAVFSSLAIVGAGTMGSLALLVGKSLGFRRLLIADVNQHRLDVMRSFGAEAVVNVGRPEGETELKELAAEGYDLVIDASGTARARQIAVQLCRPGGQVVFLGMADAATELDFIASVRREHRFQMSFGYTPVDFGRAVEFVASGAVNLAPWTEALPLERGQEAFERMIARPGSTLKMALKV
jgi:2-desacetyl-2-hydroxyethyl bacteriochlorophyllide A dehydrogenase